MVTNYEKAYYDATHKKGEYEKLKESEKQEITKSRDFAKYMVTVYLFVQNDAIKNQKIWLDKL